MKIDLDLTCELWVLICDQALDYEAECRAAPARRPEAGHSTLRPCPQFSRVRLGFSRISESSAEAERAEDADLTTRSLRRATTKSTLNLNDRDMGTRHSQGFALGGVWHGHPSVRLPSADSLPSCARMIRKQRVAFLEDRIWGRSWPPGPGDHNSGPAWGTSDEGSVACLSTSTIRSATQLSGA